MFFNICFYKDDFLMLEILTGIISGIVSGMGMGGGTILILVLSFYMRP